MNDARAALLEHRAGRLPGPGLLRRLVSHDGWHTPATLVAGVPAPLLSGPEGDRWLSLYTDAEALAEADAAHPGTPAETVLVVPGPGLFAGLGAELAGVRVDPDTPLAVHWRHEQLPTLRRWGRAVEIERLLHGQSSASLRRLRDFDAYHVVLRGLPDPGRPAQLVMAPDDKGRRLAAVFTAEDTRDAFLAAAADALGPARFTLQLNGQELFERLAALPIDGMVFNCRGPVPPRAVDKRLAEIVLRA